MPRTALLAALGVLLAALALYAAVLALLWFKQEALLFHPTPLPADYPLARAPDVQEHTVAVDGARLSVLQLRRPQARAVVFFLHGNAGNLAQWFHDPQFWRDAGVDLVMMDYRGYGKSTGRIESPQQLRADVRAVWDSVATQYAGRPVVVYGISLGTGLAADLAEQLSGEGRPPALTVLVSPYANLRTLAGEIYPWVPGALMRYPLDTERHLPGVRGPVLMIHGAQDRLIPVAHAMRLQQRVPAARLLVIPNAGHNDVDETAQYREQLTQALQGLALPER